MKFMLGVVNDAYEIPSDVKISQECRDLLKRCFEKDPKKRIKIQEVRNHSCFDFLNIQNQKKEEVLEKRVVKYDNGVYDGEYKDGKKHGKLMSEVRVIVLGRGVYKWADGDIYEG